MTTKKTATKKPDPAPVQTDGVLGIDIAMSNIMQGLGAIKKEQQNKDQNFMFRGIDQVYNAIHGLMVQQRVFCVPKNMQLVARKERPTRSGGTLSFTLVSVEYEFVCSADGSSRTFGPFIGEGMDAGDKGTNKALAVAHKYCFLQSFCVPTEDIVDPDRDAYTDVIPESQQQPPQQQAPSGFRRPNAPPSQAAQAPAPDPWGSDPLTNPNMIRAESEADAAQITDLLIGFVNKTETMNGLKSIWDTNTKNITYLQSDWPQEHARLQAAFTARAQQLRAT